MFDRQSVDALRADARSRTICGQCKSSTFVLWQLQDLSGLMGKEEVLRAEERRGITKFTPSEVDDTNPDERVGVIIRCAFFRMNVPDPFRILDCEGFKEKRGS